MINQSQAAPTELTTSQVTVAATPTLLVTKRDPRYGVTIVNTSTVAVYIGGSGVTTTTGILLPGTVGATLTLNTAAALYGIVASGTEVVCIAEVY